MTRLPHHLHIYNKPSVVSGLVFGDFLIRKYLAVRYRHRISANGWYDTASCEISVDRSEGEFIFNNFVGNRVAVFVDNPLIPAWEGLISRVTIATSTIEISRSLDEMANKIVSQYTDALEVKRTSAITNDDSINLYGTKMMVLEMGEVYDEGDTFPESLRDTVLERLGNPVITTTGAAGGNYRVSLEMIGFYQTLTWDAKEVSDSNNTDIPKRIFLSTASPSYSDNYGEFYDDDDDSQILDHAGILVSANRQLGESSWDMLLRITEGGDGAGGRRVVGIEPKGPEMPGGLGLKNRAYYRAANTAIEYAIDAYGNGQIYTQSRPIEPWDVRPDRRIRVRDIDLAVPDEDSDVKTAYIVSVEYDAERGTVQWVTDDNINLDGIFRLTTANKPTNALFGATKRLSDTNRLVDANVLQPSYGGTGGDNSTGVDGQILMRDGVDGNFMATTFATFPLDISGDETIPAGRGFIGHNIVVTGTLTVDGEYLGL